MCPSCAFIVIALTFERLLLRLSLYAYDASINARHVAKPNQLWHTLATLCVPNTLQLLVAHVGLTLSGSQKKISQTVHTKPRQLVLTLVATGNLNGIQNWLQGQEPVLSETCSHAVELHLLHLLPPPHLLPFPAGFAADVNCKPCQWQGGTTCRAVNCQLPT